MELEKPTSTWAEVVDDRVQIGAGSIEEPDDRDIDVPILAGLGSANAFFGFRRVEAAFGAKPTAFVNEAGPRGYGGKDATNALGVQSEGAEGHVPKGWVLDHVADRGDLLSRELRRCAVRTTRPIVEGAAIGEVAPSMEPGRRESQHTQGDGEGDRLLGRRNGRQDRALGLAVEHAHALRIESEAGESNQKEGQPDNGEEELHSAPEGEDFG